MDILCLFLLLRQYGAERRLGHVFQLALLFLDGALYLRYLVGPLVHVLEYGQAELSVELGTTFFPSTSGMPG